MAKETLAQRNAKMKKLMSASEKLKAQGEKIKQWEEKNLKSSNNVGRKVANESGIIIKSIQKCLQQRPKS